MNRNKVGVSVPHRAKLIVSVDRKPYPLEFKATEPTDEIIRPDVSGSYDNIAEPDIDVSGLCETILESESGPEDIKISYDLSENLERGRSDHLYTRAETETTQETDNEERIVSDLHQNEVKTETVIKNEAPDPTELNHQDAVSKEQSSESLINQDPSFQIIRVQGSIPYPEKRLKIKSFQDLKDLEQKPSAENKHWTTVDGDLQTNEGKY